MDDVTKTARFATAFAGAQYHMDCAKHQPWMRNFGIDQARQELQDAFDLLPDETRLAIMRVRDTLKIDQPAPEVRKVTSGD